MLSFIINPLGRARGEKNRGRNETMQKRKNTYEKSKRKENKKQCSANSKQQGRPVMLVCRSPFRFMK
jgi:hypothetical protein